MRKVFMGISGILLLFYLVACGSAETSSPTPTPTPSGQGTVGSIKALNLEEVAEDSITVSWELLKTEGGDVDWNLIYYIYAKTYDRNGFTKDPSTQKRHIVGQGDTVGRKDVSGLANNTPYQIVVEAKEGNSDKIVAQSYLLAYTASELTDDDIPAVETAISDSGAVTVTWEPNSEAQGYVIKSAVSDNAVGEIIPEEDVIEVVCSPDSLLCDEEDKASLQGGQLTFTVQVKRGVRYNLVVAPFNFQDLVGLQAVDQEGKLVIKNILTLLGNTEAKLSKRLDSALKDTDKVEDIKIEVKNAEPPENLVLESTGNTVTARWGHGTGAEYYYASITSNDGANAVTNTIYRYESDSRYLVGGYTSFSDLTRNTLYTVTVQSFTMISNVPNLGGSVSETITTLSTNVVKEPPVQVAAQHLTLTNEGSGKLRIVWNTPEANSVFRYNVFYWRGDDVPNSPKYAPGKGNTNILITNLQPGIYTVRIDVLSSYTDQELVTGETSVPITVYGIPSVPDDLAVNFSRGRFTNIGDKLYAIGYPLTYTYTEASGLIGDVYYYRYRVAGETWNDYAYLVANNSMVNLQVNDLSDVAAIKEGYGKQYQVEVIASNKGGFVSDPETLTFTYKSFPEPFNHSKDSGYLTVTPGNGNLTVTWPEVTETHGSTVFSYTVLLKDDPYQRPLQVTNISVSANREVVFEGLQNGEGYYVTVIPNGAGVGSIFTALSMEVDDALTEGKRDERILTNYTGAPEVYTPQGAPEAVRELAVAPGNNAATVTWKEATTGSPATKYELQYLKGVSTPIININVGGPDADAELSKLSWGEDINDIVIANDSGSYSRTVTVDVSVVNVFRVRAVNNEGDSDYHYYALGSDRSQVPGPVTDVKFDNFDQQGTFFTVNWKPSTDPGRNEEGDDAQLTGYRVSWGTDAQANKDSAEIPHSDGDGFTNEITGLTPGTQYFVKIQAKNDAGENNYNSGFITNIYTVQAPGPVSSDTIVYSDHKTDGFTVSWKAVTNAGYHPEGKLGPPGYPQYRVFYLKDDQGQWQRYGSGISVNQMTLTGLVSGSKYRVRVESYNLYSSSDVGAEGGDTWVLSSPGSVTELKVSDPTYSKTTTPDTAGFTVSWMAPENTGNTSKGTDAAITGYQVTYAVAGEEEYKSETHGESTAEHVFTGLNPGTEYKIRVQTETKAGTSIAADVSAWTPSLPGAVDPGSIVFSEPTDTTIRITWTAPELGRAGGSSDATTNTRYQVEITTNTAQESSYTVVDSDHEGVFIDAKDLDKGTTYWARITASNTWGEAEPSISTNTGTTTETVATSPSAVEDLSVDSSSHNRVVLSWSAPTNAGAVNGVESTISSYRVKYKKTADSEFREITTEANSEGVKLDGALTADSTTATVVGLDGYTEYAFSVVAVNSGNRVGEEATPVTETTSLAPPAELGRTVGSCVKATSVDLTWTSSTGATSYKLYRDSDELIDADVTSYTDTGPGTGLTPGATYTYRVKACRDGSCSADRSLSITMPANTNTFKSIIESGKIPTNLADYDQKSQDIFSLYKGGADLKVHYLKPGGSSTGDGTSFDNAKGDPNAVLTGIVFEGENKVDVVLLAGGTYYPSDMSMLPYVAIVGGVDECLELSRTVTVLDGNGENRVFKHQYVASVALLYGVTIANGYAKDYGGGMYNDMSSSPTLIDVTFSGNHARYGGGGMYNRDNSSPTLIRVTFSENSTDNNGGGMQVGNGSPTLEGVTFSGNTAGRGGGMSAEFASPTLEGVTFSGNTANYGSGMYVDNSTATLVGVTFSTNHKASALHNYSSSVTLVGATFFQGEWETAIYENNDGATGSVIINSIFWKAGDRKHIFFIDNDDGGDENLRIYNSIIKGGTGELASRTTYSPTTLPGYGLTGAFSFNSQGASSVKITFTNISDEDPGLGHLADNGGSVLTHAILNSDSPAKDEGVYVRRKKNNNDRYSDNNFTFYYSADNIKWYTVPTLLGVAITPPSDAEPLNTADATGYTFTDRPDLGAYEYGSR